MFSRFQPSRFIYSIVTSVMALVITFALMGFNATQIHPASAASTITVNSLNNSGGTCPGATCTLSAALATATGNSGATTINFGISGKITLSTTLSIVNINSNPITIDGTGQSIIIDGGTTNSVTGVEIFNLGYMNVSTVTLTSLTLQNGSTSSYDGGAIYNGGTLTINNCVLSGNASTNTFGGNAGAIYNLGTLTINNSTISNNKAHGYGGGVQNNGTLTISNTILSGNTATTSTGGGVSNDGPLSINNSTLSGNFARNGGGGVFNGSTMAVITNSTLSNNTATYGGGGVSNNYTLTISNSTLFGNSTSGASNSSGGGIDNSGTLTLGNSTVSGNTAAVNGGAILNYGTLNLFSNILAGNSASASPDVDDGGLYGTIHSYGHNLVGDGTGSVGLTDGVNGDEVGTAASPINPKLGSLASNGGSTATMALFDANPAIKTGLCTGAAAAVPPAPAVTADQRGISRAVPCDIGSYEGGVAVIDSMGIYRNGTFYLRLHNSQGFADFTVGFNPAGKNFPVVGDWTSTGYDTVGVYDQNSGNFTLCKANVTATCANSPNLITLTLGNPNDTPFSGRWMLSAAHAGAGVYRPSNGVLYLKNTLTTGFADHAMVMGLPGDVGVAGDWTGKNFDSPGIYRPGSIAFFLSNQVTNGPVYADINLTYGAGSDLPIAGDWIAEGHDGVGMFRPTNGFAYLKNMLTTGFADNAFFYGTAGDIPVAGHWQVIYPPAPPIGLPSAPSVLITKTPIPNGAQGSVIVPGNNQIGG